MEEDVTVSEGVRSRIRELHLWFNPHLPVPPDGPLDRRAIFWFRMKPDLGVPAKVSPWKRRPLTKLAARTPRIEVPSEAAVDAPPTTEVIARLKECIRLMESANLRVRMIETEKPGYVVYEDAYQIAATPFKDAAAEHYLDGWLGS